MAAPALGLAGVPRLLLEVPLRPLQGRRFQPTGFPDLGAALYQTDRGQELLVESVQSTANRMELVCWDPVRQDVIQPLAGISYIRVERDAEFLTSTILEAHRINSSYILGGSDASFLKTLQAETNALEERPVDASLLARILMKYDCNCLLHGAFLPRKELAGGRLRVPRALSGFIEATGVRVATSGGVKRDDVDPTGGKARDGKAPSALTEGEGIEADEEAPAEERGSEKGFGHIPYSRTEYTAEEIRAYFNIDLSQIRTYGLGDSAADLLAGLALFKVARFLQVGLRLRTACDLEPAGEVVVTRPQGWTLPPVSELEERLPGLVAAAAAEGLFADPAVTTVHYVR